MLAAILFLKESLDVKKRKPFESFSKIITLATFSPAKSILPLVSCGLIFYTAMSMMESIFPLWANKIFSYGPSNIGGVFFMLGSLGVIIQGGLIGRLTNLLGEKKLIQLAALSLMTGLILIGSATFAFSLWIGLFFFGCGSAIFNPSLSSLISKSADPTSRGQYLGHYQAACSMGRVIGPSFSGVLYSYFHESTPFYTGAIIAIPVLILIASFTLRKMPKIIK